MSIISNNCLKKKIKSFTIYIICSYFDLIFIVRIFLFLDFICNAKREMYYNNLFIFVCFSFFYICIHKKGKNRMLQKCT